MREGPNVMTHYHWAIYRLLLPQLVEENDQPILF